MRYQIDKGWMIDKNELPEMFGPATTMWVLASEDQPDVALLCYPLHMYGTIDVDVVTALGLEPEDCFWRMAKVEIVATEETAVRETGGTFQSFGEEFTNTEGCDAWHLRDGSYVLVREDTEDP
jgi:hypothetical protein